MEGNTPQPTRGEIGSRGERERITRGRKGKERKNFKKKEEVIYLVFSRIQFVIKNKSSLIQNLWSLKEEEKNKGKKL